MSLLLLLGAMAQACAAQAPRAQSPCEATPNPVITVPEIVYSPDAAIDRLDLYLPWRRAGEPLVIFVHGGGWAGGDKTSYGHIGKFFARCGIAFANINYPLAPRVRADGQARAVLAAAHWLAHRAAVYGYAGDRVFLFGHSAGAQIVTLAALWRPLAQQRTNLHIEGVIALDGMGYAPPGPGVKPLGSKFVNYYRTAFGPDSSRWRQFDVEQAVSHHAPPFLIVHGGDDTSVPEEDSAALTGALVKAGVAVEYRQPAGRDHTTVLSALVRDPNDPTAMAVEHFILTGSPKL